MVGLAEMLFLRIKMMIVLQDPRGILQILLLQLALTRRVVIEEETDNYLLAVTTNTREAMVMVEQRMRSLIVLAKWLRL